MTGSSAVSDDMTAPEIDLTQAQTRRAIFALSVGGFAIGTGEFVIMGLLPDAAENLQVSIPQAGHLISAYALGVVAGAPLLAILGAKFPRRAFLVGLMIFFAAANIIGSTIPGYGPVICARFIAGLPHGIYFGVAALVAAGLVPKEKRTQAVAMVITGLTTATLIGVPIVASIGQALGWRIAFTIVGLIGGVTAFLIRHWVPPVPGDRNASPLREVSALGRKQVILTLATGSIGFGGLFSVFSYIKPTMTELAHLPAGLIPLVLFLFGFGMFFGTLGGSRLADRALDRTVGLILVWSVLILSGYCFTSSHMILGPINVLLIGTMMSLAAVLQTRLMEHSGDAQTLPAALNHSAFNFANALGAWLGGLAIDHGFGWSSTGWVGAILAAIGLAIHLWAVFDLRKPKAVQPDFAPGIPIATD